MTPRNVHKKGGTAEPAIVMGDTYSQIEPGTYQATCCRANYRPGFVGQRTLYVEFRIYGGFHHGTEVFMACPAHHKKLRQRHKLYKQWALAIDRRPSSRERFSKSVFTGKHFEVKVKSTQCRWPNSNEPLPDHMQYSIVETIVRPLSEVSL